MGFGFFGMRPALIIAVVGMVAALPYSFNYLRDYSVLTGSLVAYAVSFLVCYLMSYRSKENFDYDVIKKVTGDFDPEVDQAVQPDQTPLENVAAQKQGEYYDCWTHFLCVDVACAGGPMHVCDCSRFI